VIAGQGTLGLEILSQLPDVDVVVASIGGGGLCSGMGTAIKSIQPKVKIIACQALNSQAMTASLTKHALTQVQTSGTIADGIAVKQASPEMFQVLDGLVDQVFTSDEDEIAMNILRFMEKAKLVVEGSGAIVLGALDHFKDELQGKKVVLVISGGNIDVNLVARIIDRGLIRSGRRVHLTVQILDRPGSLAKLTSLIAGLGVNVLQATHDRSEMNLKLDETEVELMLETKGPNHSLEVIAALEKHCTKVNVVY